MNESRENFPNCARHGLTFFSIAGEWRLAKALGSATVGNNPWRRRVAAWTAPPKAFSFLHQTAMSLCLVSLGSNEGDRQANLEAAVARLAAHPHVKLIAHSSWRETIAVGGPVGQSNFLNGAVKLETSLAPRELLGCLQQIESDLGRRRAERWGPRPIDLDLLLYDELILAASELQTRSGVGRGARRRRRPSGSSPGASSPRLRGALQWCFLRSG